MINTMFERGCKNMNKIVTINSGEKFKNNAVSINIPLALDETITDFNLISQILKRGCKKYSSTKASFAKASTELYGAVFDIVTEKKGEILLVTFYMQFIDNKYAYDKEDVFVEAIQFLSEYINNPLTKNEEFNKEYFHMEKENLKDLIESRIDDKDEYTIERSAEVMLQE